jgi:hypothetical protein
MFPTECDTLAGCRGLVGTRAEVYLDPLRVVPLTVDVEQAAHERIAAEFSQVVMLLART